MPKYASYDPAAAAASPVTGWYDTDAFTYPSLPAAAGLLQITDTQWSARLASPSSWAVENGALVSGTPVSVGPTVQQQAKSALDASDMVALRCFKAGVAFPLDWQTYTTTLRSIVNGTASPLPTALPAQPAYPSGT